MVEKGRKATIRVELTPEQQEQIRQATGREVSALELSAEELEDRVAPRCITKPIDKSTPL